MKEKMKLILSIVSYENASEIQNNLIKKNFFITRLATKGGFLKENNSTFVIGAKESQVEQILKIIKDYSKKKTQMIPNNIINQFGAFYNLSNEINTGGSITFVLDIEQFIKL
ncbi:cyclic-di-AMP receptor [Candidatus Phytoplasma pyri]|uniref:cyclic-di-AMP receptor n=1 Tax=Candidatus Phytoplasma pyri TaxID=47566 RepID=UPI003983B240